MRIPATVDCTPETILVPDRRVTYECTSTGEWRETHLSGVVADGERGALVFGRGVPVAVLGGEREALGVAGLQLGRQPLVQALLGRPHALALLVHHAQQALRLLGEEGA